MVSFYSTFLSTQKNETRSSQLASLMKSDIMELLLFAMLLLLLSVSQEEPINRLLPDEPIFHKRQTFHHWHSSIYRPFWRAFFILPSWHDDWNDPRIMIKPPSCPSIHRCISLCEDHLERRMRWPERPTDDYSVIRFVAVDSILWMVASSTPFYSTLNGWSEWSSPSLCLGTGVSSAIVSHRLLRSVNSISFHCRSMFPGSF